MKKTNDLSRAAEIALKQSLGVKAGEKVLIITDKNLKHIGTALYDSAKKITDTDIIEIPVGKVNGEEPPKEISKKMLNYDVILLPTTKSMTHTEALKNACAKKARAATLPGITEESMQRSLAVDYELMAKETNKIKDLLDKGKKVKVTSRSGTELEFSIENRKAHAGSGMLREKNLFGNLPAGEAYIAPVEGTAEGKYVIDGSILDIKIEDPITIIVKDGFAVQIDGEKEAEELKKVLESINDKNAYNIAELGIGTNPEAKLTGNVLEDEKVKGTAHIALGKNSSFGGNIEVPVHIDGVFTKPDIYIDEKMIIKEGRLLL